MTSLLARGLGACSLTPSNLEQEDQMITRASLPAPRPVRHAVSVMGRVLALAAVVFVSAVAGVGAAPVRVPELVSNADTNASNIGRLMRVSADGHAVAWYSLAGYADTRGANGAGVYVGRRTDSGWKVIPYWPDTKLVRSGISSLIGGYLFSRDLSSMVASTGGQFDPGDTNGDVADVYRFEATGSPTWISRPQGMPQGPAEINVVGVSDDGSTVFLTGGYNTYNPRPLTPDVPAGAYQLYRWRDGALEAVGRDTDGSLILSTDSNKLGPSLGSGSSQVLAAGGGQGGRAADSFAVSSDGSRFVYRDVIGNSRFSRVFLHEDGVGVTEISLSQRSGSVGQPAPSGAIMVGSTPELGRIYLQSRDQLTDDAPAEGGDYVYDTVTGRLAFSNPDSSVEEGTGNKSGLLRISDDGEYVYFASTEVLAAGAQLNASNLYVRHGEATRFVGELRDGSVGVYPVNNGTPYPEYTATGLDGDGSRFVFLSSARLAGVDTGGFAQLYLYDATTGSLTCVSCRPDGSPSEGSAGFGAGGDYVTTIARSISADGSTVAFTSDDALVPEDTNGVADVYEYSGGQIALVSGGTSRFGSTFEGLSPDGMDLYFLTRDSLSAQDTNNGFSDLYDARVGGRRSSAAATATACAGDDCQGPVAEPVRVSSPGSSAYRGPVGRPVGRGVTFRVASLTAAQRRSLARSGRVAVAVSTSGPGLVTARMTARLGQDVTQVAAGRKAATRAGTVRVVLRLSRRARQALAAHRRLALRLTVSVSGGGPSKTRSLTLVRSAGGK